MTQSTKPHVVILGGGFAGIYAARSLRKAPVRITLIDRRNHHVFQPLLYQVATAALSPSDIAAPIRSILRKQRNVQVLLAEARAIDLAGKKIVLDEGDLAYDTLIVATGATHSYFGHSEWAPLAPGLKTLEDAIDIRTRVLLAYEAAERATDPAIVKALLTFVVVGGGPTGVEMAGALSEISRHALAGEFRTIAPENARVLLVEGDDRVLQAYPEKLSASAKHQLEKLGVEVKTSARVTAIDEEGVDIGTERVQARTVVWAAGVAASPLVKSLGVPLDRAGRVIVDDRLNPPGHPEVFVVGDVASLQQDGKPVPGVAPAAIQGGKWVARAIRARVEQTPDPRPFRYKDKGSLATIGRASAVADMGKLKLSGFLAWLAWGLIHVLFLIGFRNRFIVIFEWLWQYVTFRRGTRLITGDEQLRFASPTVAPAVLAPSPILPPPTARVAAGAAAPRPLD